MPRLHLGSGHQHLDGWINIDNQPLAGVDQVLDLTGGLPYDGVEFIFAEHFIEHLTYADALALLRECRRALRDDGVLRLSTPNLDWVWASHYRLDLDEADQVRGCFAINGAFRAWGHQFLYNERTLTATLHDAGFATVARCEYGESAYSTLRGLERHEKSTDLGALSHILIVEAWGRGGNAPDYLAEPREVYLRDVSLR
jgi:predicted SAM-dependent methyltransferase